MSSRCKGRVSMQMATVFQSRSTTMDGAPAAMSSRLTP
jgi:hypothetical protein